MDKFNRRYSLRIQQAFVNSPLVTAVDSANQFITVERPFTMEFETNQNTLAAVKTAHFRVYNLSKDKRTLIRKDQWDGGIYRKVILDAGYGQTVPNIFIGNILQAWSVREGTNFITQITAQDNGFATTNATTNLSYPAGTPRQYVIEQLVKSLSAYGIGRGAVGTFSGSLPRGNSFSGDTISILNTLTGGNFFVSNGKAWCLNYNEAIRGELEIINSQTGLLNTPVRERNYIYLDMIFEPRLQMGQSVLVDSSTGAVDTNQIWKVISIKHKGTISDAVCGDCTTSVGLALPQAAIVTVGNG